MEHSQPSCNLEPLVEDIRRRIFSNMDDDPYLLVSPSAYDTAWLAMIPDSGPLTRPMFQDCLEWVLNNQRDDGSWGSCDAHGNPTIESLPATLACIVALHRWNAGKPQIQNGLEYIHANVEKHLELGDGGNTVKERCPRWFAIVFPGMVELARTAGLDIVFPDGLQRALMDILRRRQQCLESSEQSHYPHLLAYLEALPPSHVVVNEEHVAEHLRADGSLFNSPSATARAFMATGNARCLAYLQSQVRTCSNGVPPTYPIDGDLVKLCVINQLMRLGLADHFIPEIKSVLAEVHREYSSNEESGVRPVTSVATQLYKDSLAFQLLRMHGYGVSPWTFCWFLENQEVVEQIEKNGEYFSSAMLNVLRATDLRFVEECQLEDARSFAIKSLQETVSPPSGTGVASFQKLIEHELKHPWVARLEHLEHRMWIEEKDRNALWMGKASLLRLPRFYDDKLVKFAIQNYEFRQSVYHRELEELKRWSNDKGLTDMGFGREKTTYCYFAVAASNVSLPSDSYVRLVVAKSGILVTVADDFFDMEGSLDELKRLTDAIKRWDGQGLSGHSMTIFHALDDLVEELAEKHLRQEGSDITSYLKDIWCETFTSWLKEATWSKTGRVPSMEQYIETGMVSIATHTLVFTASCFLKLSLPIDKFWPPLDRQYHNLTKLLMLVSRLLNDIQSYQREMEEGKQNIVMLYMQENPEAEIEDSVGYVREIIERKEKELVELALMAMDNDGDLPEACKRLHLSCLKAFSMLFHDSNQYDTNDSAEMVDAIRKAIYIPINDLPIQTTTSTKKSFLKNDHSRSNSEKIRAISKCYIRCGKTSRGAAPQVRWHLPRNDGYVNKVKLMPPCISLSFV